jgi:C-terminal processing protease CtpA/Prc
MVGRWKNGDNGVLEPLAIQGVASSPDWKVYIESMHYNFPLHLQEDPYLPTDSMALYLAGVPAINFFTGVHADYHTPRDTEDKINYDGLLTVAQATTQLAEAVAANDQALAYHEAPKAPTELRRGFRIFLGTIPDYTDDTVKGVRISGVVSGGPAEKAGIRKGDVIVEFVGKKIENIHDYVFTFELARPNEPAKIVVEREGKREELSIVPQAKE